MNSLVINKYWSFIVLLLISTIGLIGCSGAQRNENTSRDSFRKVLYGQPIPLNESAFSMIPIRIIDRKYIADSYYLPVEEYGHVTDDCQNFIFHDTNTGKNHLLTTKHFYRMSYEPFIIYVPDRDGNIIGTKRYLLYKTVSEDTNKDGVYDWNDATVVYISDDTGHHFKSLTPEMTKVLDWVTEPNTGNVFFRILEDTDNNRSFDLKDDISIVRIDLLDLTKIQDNKEAMDSEAVIQKEDRKQIEDMMLQIQENKK